MKYEHIDAFDGVCCWWRVWDDGDGAVHRGWEEGRRMSESVMANFHPTSEYVTFDQLRDELRKKPDLVEVVRCRDCKHFMSGDLCKLQDEWNEFPWLEVEPDGFCAWGERKD